MEHHIGTMEHQNGPMEHYNGPMDGPMDGWTPILNKTPTDAMRGFHPSAHPSDLTDDDGWPDGFSSAHPSDLTDDQMGFHPSVS